MYHLPAAEFHTPVASCCGPMPAVNEAKYLGDFPLLEKRVNKLGQSPDQAIYYRCAICGQVWEQRYEPFMHADVNFLLKSEVNPDGTLVRLAIDLRSAPAGRVIRCEPVEKIVP